MMNRKAARRARRARRIALTVALLETDLGKVEF